MAVHSLQQKQILKADIKTLWEFIATPKGLQEITPDNMGFEIITQDLPQTIYPGQIINYVVRPLFGIKLKWCTEITHVKEGSYFVDEQRSGPYAMWHHEHRLQKVEGGTLMTDIIHYRLPLGFIGDSVHTVFVKKKLQSIFEHRFKVLEKKFNT